jgi:hypothetical protein
MMPAHPGPDEPTPRRRHPRRRHPAIDVGAVGFDPADPAFIADPYPAYPALRDLGPVLYYPAREVHLLHRPRAKTTSKNVRMMILMSNHSDQFSM